MEEPASSDDKAGNPPSIIKPLIKAVLCWLAMNIFGLLGVAFNFKNTVVDVSVIATVISLIAFVMVIFYGAQFVYHAILLIAYRIRHDD